MCIYIMTLKYNESCQTAKTTITPTNTQGWFLNRYQPFLMITSQKTHRRERERERAHASSIVKVPNTYLVYSIFGNNRNILVTQNTVEHDIIKFKEVRKKTVFLENNTQVNSIFRLRQKLEDWSFCSQFFTKLNPLLTH